MSPLSHHRPNGPARRRLIQTRRGQEEHGYVLVMFALMLVPLLLMVGFSIDVGSWYNRASDIQKAADAAALAGVVWLPDVGTATSYALAAAQRNGFTNGTDHVTVTVTPVVGAGRDLQVTITDSQVESFFYQKFGGHTISISRSATAEYVLPVPLGSPNNTFGNDTSQPSSSWPNFWANIHGPGTDANNGDAFAPSCKGSANCSTSTNPSYRPTGYLYSIDVPTGGVTNMDVQIYDANLAARSAETVDTGDTKYTSTGTITTNYTMYNTDNTPLDPSDNPTAVSAGFCTSGAGSWSLLENSSDTTYKNTWVSLCKHTGTVPAGRYFLRVTTTGTGAGANRYAVRVLASSTAQPLVDGYGDMSIYNNVNVGNSTFYLADVDPADAGLPFQVNLYDPGEVNKNSDGTGGNGTMQILDPTGAVVSSCTATTTSSSSSFGLSATLTPCQFQTASAGTALFNGAWVNLVLTIPTTYSCTYGTVPGCWWKVKYIINGQANDTTTWSAAIEGDPVHLVS